MAGTGKGRTPRQRRFGDHVRHFRQELGLTQEELAYKADLARAYIGSLESGLRNPSLETICALAIALKVDAADLVEGCQRSRGRPRP